MATPAAATGAGRRARQRQLRRRVAALRRVPRPAPWVLDPRPDLRRQRQSVGGQFDVSQPNEDGTGHQWPAIVALEGGGFAATWSDTNTSDIWARRFDGPGVAQGSFISVNQTDSGGERGPASRTLPMEASPSAGTTTATTSMSAPIIQAAIRPAPNSTSPTPVLLSRRWLDYRAVDLRLPGTISAKAAISGGIFNATGVQQGNDFSIATVEHPTLAICWLRSRRRFCRCLARIRSAT